MPAVSVKQSTNKCKQNHEKGITFLFSLQILFTKCPHGLTNLSALGCRHNSQWYDLHHYHLYITQMDNNFIIINYFLIVVAQGEW